VTKRVHSISAESLALEHEHQIGPTPSEISYHRFVEPLEHVSAEHTIRNPRDIAVKPVPKCACEAVRLYL
jgi:hypothetical protein